VGFRSDVGRGTEQGRKYETEANAATKARRKQRRRQKATPTHYRTRRSHLDSKATTNGDNAARQDEDEDEYVVGVLRVKCAVEWKFEVICREGELFLANSREGRGTTVAAQRTHCDGQMATVRRPR
jgi:hypothetical protein